MDRDVFMTLIVSANQNVVFYGRHLVRQKTPKSESRNFRGGQRKITVIHTQVNDTNKSDTLYKE